MYPIIKVPDDAATALEPLGTKQKFWFIRSDGKNWLFKRNRDGCGDDWAEKIACGLCDRLGIPHASYELAVWKGLRGIVTPSVVPKGAALVHGNELLPAIDAEYPGTQRFRVRQHTIGRVVTIIGAQYRREGRSESVRAPLGVGTSESIRSSVDFFIGYLMLDVLIANQDRHHENWALLASSEPALHLAPTFDHASSLGTGETDKNRTDRLTTKDQNRSMRSYVERARSAFYRSPNDKKPLTTIEAFVEAGQRGARAACSWLDRLEALEERDFDEILCPFSDDVMSGRAKEFARQILVLNRNRLRTVKEVLQ